MEHPKQLNQSGNLALNFTTEPQKLVDVTHPKCPKGFPIKIHILTCPLQKLQFAIHQWFPVSIVTVTVGGSKKNGGNPVKPPKQSTAHPQHPPTTKGIRPAVGNTPGSAPHLSKWPRPTILHGCLFLGGGLLRWKRVYVKSHGRNGCSGYPLR